ncbi:fungal Zn(2)-Cys(6) binuclear cluster domain containing protein [Acanthamoeba castellanii str. Neff]|uniref:Fungal Zn(2)-Cys(6) binuclear cluster domain containing protein n=1 Tax=Acanthamoeba castellanii (strain ATCC 30010 / Neff) TaxID=1257118 RepID=L8H8J5_ACACF|nr:fungal Zn(2)-Cys(6) binuclear cluster domain containing protein [Acanthamoeba castellanii str. Neff]ELR21490.1 fungal Zn(2)-Cys(6) binuclear cluster domain containing protein [Acanthamoeba castellanii str. Neff]
MEPATPTTPARHGPCMTCRLRHVLCDRQRPCGRCARLGETDHCVDPPRAHKRGRPRKEHPPPPPTRAAITTAAPPLRPAARSTTAEPVASSPPSLQAPTNAGSHQLREEGEEGHHGLDRQGAEGRGGPVPPLDTTLSLALLVELKKVRREREALPHHPFSPPIRPAVEQPAQLPVRPAVDDRARGSEQYLRPGQEMPATLVTGFNDQFCNLFKYSREELEELNGLRLYPRSVWEALTPLAEEVFCKCPTSAGPIYTFVAPMIDKQGGILYTEASTTGKAPSPGA